MSMTVWGNFEHETEVKRDFINVYVSFMAVYSKANSSISNQFSFHIDAVAASVD